MFDAVKVKNECVQWIRDWFAENGPNCNAIVGISGGKDSTVVAALCVEALGANRVLGVLMPNHTQADIDDALSVVESLKIDYSVYDIGYMYDSFIEEDEAKGKFTIVDTINPAHPCGIKMSEQTKINLAPRLRMVTLYAIAQSYNGRVANTCNLSEDWIGYSTRYGDTAGDFSPLSNLTTEEVIAIGETLGIPKNLIYKVPSDGLCGLTDEDRFGFTYKVLNKYIRTGVCEDEKIKQKIDDLHKKNMFKLLPMPKFEYAPN